MAKSYEKSAADKKKDAEEAKKRGMKPARYEQSKADKREDARGSAVLGRRK